MKKLTILFSVAFASLLAGCRNGGVEDVPVTMPQGNDAFPYINLTKAETQVSANANAFGIEMFKELVKEQGDVRNTVFSPFSLSMALALTASGAQGETLSEMVAALGFKDLSSSDIGSYYHKLLAAMSSVDPGVKINSANAIWSCLPLRKEYVTEVTDLYDAKIDNLDFSGDPAKAAGIINDWAFEKTCGLIPQFVERIDPSTMMLLVNALYFKGTWSSGPYEVSERKFKNINRTVTKCDFVDCTMSHIPSYFGKDASLIKLPYGNGSFSMVFLLPAEGVGFENFVGSLSSEKWQYWLSAMSERNIVSRFPKFKDSGSFDDMVAALRHRGMEKAFGISADFGKMCSGSLYIDNVFQKSVIEVSESGSEAAAVTAVEMKLTSAYNPDVTSKPIFFIADRPFLYAIVENSHNTLLFLGQHVSADR